MKENNTHTKKTYSLLNEIFNTAADGMGLIDKEFNIFAINTTLSIMLKVDKEGIIGQKCYEVLAGPACKTERCCLVRFSTISPCSRHTDSTERNSRLQKNAL